MEKITFQNTDEVIPQAQETESKKETSTQEEQISSMEMEEAVEGKRNILVLVSGVVGENVAKELLKNDSFAVRCVCVNSSDEFVDDLRRTGAKVMKGDFSNKNLLNTVMKNINGNCIEKR